MCGPHPKKNGNQIVQPCETAQWYINTSLHGKTHNANESFKWLKCRKSVFVNEQSIELGVNSAILQFNDGAHGTSKALEQFSIKHGIYTNIKHGIYTNIGSSKKDKISIRWSSTKSSKAGGKNVNDYVALKKESLKRIMNQKKFVIFLVDLKVIYAIDLCIIFEYVDLSLFKYFFSKYRFWSIFIQNLISSEVVSLFI